MISNHIFNVKLFKDRHNYIELTSLEQVSEFLAYLEWMHPYDCTESVRNHAEIAEKCLRKHGVVFFNVFGLSYHSVIERILTMCLGTPFNDGFKSHEKVIKWEDFNHPLFIPSQRDDAKLSPDMISFLQSLQ